MYKKSKYYTNHPIAMKLREVFEYTDLLYLSNSGILHPILRTRTIAAGVWARFGESVFFTWTTACGQLMCRKTF